MSKYVGANDQGTSSTRFIIFDHGGNVVAVDQKEHRQIYPKPGWVEQDALEIWERTQEVIAGALAKSGISSEDIAALGVTNQRETTLVWDKNTGEPVYNAIVWQDTRTDVICNKLAKQAGQNRFRRKTGLPLATYFSSPKIKWILDNIKGLKVKARKGELLFGNMDTWLIWKLTGEHVTDVTNASRTMPGLGADVAAGILVEVRVKVDGSVEDLAVLERTLGDGAGVGSAADVPVLLHQEAWL